MPFKNREERIAYYKEYNKKWYPANKASVLARTQRRRKHIVELVDSIKKSSSCVDCGASDYRFIDFDHIPERGQKIHCISEMRCYGWSDARVLAEIAKCEPRCSNCHRLKTEERKAIAKS